MNCTFLDFVWSGLIAASMSSMLVMTVHWAISVTLASRLSARLLKWYFHVQYSVLAAAVLAGFSIAFVANPELATGCFEKFASNAGGFPLTRLLAGAWIAGVVSMLAYDVLRSWKLRRWINEQSVAGDLEFGLKETAQAAFHARGVTVRVSALNPSPFVFGFLLCWLWSDY